MGNKAKLFLGKKRKRKNLENLKKATAQRRIEWLRLIDREDLLEGSGARPRVCEAHFRPTFVLQNSIRKLLKKNAIPQLLLPSNHVADKGTQTNIEKDKVEIKYETVDANVDIEYGTVDKNIDIKYKTVDENVQRKCETTDVNYAYDIETNAEVQIPLPLSNDPLSEVQKFRKRLRFTAKTFLRLCDRFLNPYLARVVKKHAKIHFQERVKSLWQRQRKFPGSYCKNDSGFDRPNNPSENSSLEQKCFPPPCDYDSDFDWPISPPENRLKNEAAKQAEQTTNTSGDTPETKYEGTSSEQQEVSQPLTKLEMVKQIKNNLKKLRRKSNAEETLLELEVFPQKSEHKSQVRKFVDESQSFDEADDLEGGDENSDTFYNNDESFLKDRNVLKRKNETPPTVPGKRKQAAIQPKLIVKGNSVPHVEHVFFNPSPDTPKHDGNKNDYEVPVIPSSVEYKERLYNFGRFISEQLMKFTEKDSIAAQAEIKEVLKKYRLKYKIINCLKKPDSTAPSTPEGQSEPHRRTKKGQPTSKAKPVPNKQPKKGTKTKSVPINTRKPAAAETTVNTMQTATNDLNSLNSAGPSTSKVTNKVTPPNIAAQLAKQTFRDGIPNVVLTPVNSTTNKGDVPTSLMIVSDNGALKLTAARIESTGAVLNFPDAPRINLEKLTPNNLNPDATSVPIQLQLNPQTDGHMFQQTVQSTSQSDIDTATTQPTNPETSDPTLETETRPEDIETVPVRGHVNLISLPDGSVDPLKIEPKVEDDESLDIIVYNPEHNNDDDDDEDLYAV